jgi:hypothetical protein
MKDVQDMSDYEYRVYRSRLSGAARYRAEGHDWFAERVEKGLEDGCNAVRLGRFFQNLPDQGAEVAAG